jgi:hypothetical protein
LGDGIHLFPSLFILPLDFSAVYNNGGISKMETNQKLDEIGVGTKETIKLLPEPVTVLGVQIKDVQDKEKTKVVGRKVVLLCKHSKKEESLEISEIEYIKDKNVKTSTLWVNLDDDGLIQKGSPVAVLIAYTNCKSLKEIAGKTLNTTLDVKGYLCIKAY